MSWADEVEAQEDPHPASPPATTPLSDWQQTIAELLSESGWEASSPLSWAEEVEEEDSLHTTPITGSGLGESPPAPLPPAPSQPSSWKQTISQLFSKSGWDNKSNLSWADDSSDDDDSSSSSTSPGDTSSNDEVYTADTELSDDDEYLASPASPPLLFDRAEQNRAAQREYYELYGYYGSHPDGFSLQKNPPPPRSEMIVGGPLSMVAMIAMSLTGGSLLHLHPVPALVVTTPDGDTLYPHDECRWPDAPPPGLYAVAYEDEDLDEF